MFVKSCVTGITARSSAEISRTKMKRKLRVKTRSYHVLHLFTSTLRVHISRLLSKIASKLRNLRSSVFNSSPRFALHVNETDIMYNISKTRSSLPHRAETSAKHVLETQLLFQLLSMLLHDSHFLPNETTYRASCESNATKCSQ